MSGPAGWLPPRLVAAGIVALAVAWGGYLAWLVRADPDVVFLASDGCAEWMVADEPVRLDARPAGMRAAHFRTWVDAGPAREAVLTLRALRLADVVLDGRSVFATPRDMRAWKQEYRVPLHLAASERPRELLIGVLNQNGPPAMRACAPEIGVSRGSAWEVRVAQSAPWSAAVVAAPRLPDLSRRFPSPAEALLGIWPLVAAVWGLGAAATAAMDRFSSARFSVSPPTFRWILVGAWVVLGANNLAKLPPYVGFDVEGHLAYIRYLVDHWRVPLATDGWQMFQPPLYHALSALLVWVPARAFVDEGTAAKLLRLVPLACGAMQVELAYRAVRRVFPDRDDLQRLGTLLGGLLPISVYASQYVGNEPLTGCLTAAAVVLLLGWLRTPDAALDARSHWLLGIALGLAMLAKPTAVLVVGPALLVLAHAHAQAGEGPMRFVRAGGRVTAALALAAGWYYGRNWLLLGVPFVGGWDATRGIDWWQDPGYRLPAHLTSFGDALRLPIYGGVAGLWDAEYTTFWLDGWLSSVMDYDHRPPWNYALMLPAPWLALVPMAALVAGVATAPWQAPAVRRPLLLAAGLVALYLAATLSLYLQVPFFAAAKGTQLLGLAPCFAVLGAAGFGVLGASRVARPVLYGGIACWALSTYLAYFVR